MGKDRSQENLVLDYATRMKRAEMDRRQFFLRSVASGAGATAIAAGLTARGITASAAAPAAQDVPQDQLVTISQEQQQTWLRNFNPLVTNDAVRWPTNAGIYEPLIIHNVINGEVLPWLATEWAFSEDNLTLTFTTREGVTWSDGTPFTAADVAFTFNTLKANTALAGAYGGARAVLDDRISTIEATDEKTVVFTFSEVYTVGLWDLGIQSIAPEHIFKDVADLVTFTNENPVGTGPFTEVAVFEAQYWELHRNPTYWQEGKPYVQGLRFPAYPNNDAANLATTNGENDWAANFIPDIETTFVAKDPEHFNYWFPSTGNNVQLYLNTTIAPFDNVDVRKALSMAIDREQVVQIAMYDYTRPADATGLSDAYPAWVNQAAIDAGKPLVTRDVDAANALLDAAGLTRDGDVRKLPDGTEMTYEINVVTGWSDWVQSVQIIAQNFEEIGITATVKSYDFAAWIELVQKGDFTMSIGWSSGGPTPYNFYRGQMSNLVREEIGTAANENWHRYANEEADALLTQFAQTSDVDVQKGIALQLQQLFVDTLPSIPLFPGPEWGESNSSRFTDFPSAENPYAILATFANDERLVTLTTIKPVGAA